MIKNIDAKHVSNAVRAQILVEALPYIQKYVGQILVVKYGGHAMVNQELKEAVMGDIVLLHQIGVKVVLVHGGGPEISETLDRFGKESKFIDGLRVTDEETAEIVQMVLAGKISKGLVSLLNRKGGKAVGVSGADGNLIQAKAINKTLGYVGEISEINTNFILDILKDGYIPVVSSIGTDNEGHIWNINADTAAASIAGKLAAKSLISLTDTPGILANPENPDSLINELNVSDAPALISSGVISGGMIPKVNSCVEAIRRGVEQVFILDGRVPHAILIETLTDEGLGTMLTKG